MQAGLSFEAQDNETGATTTYRSIISYLSTVAALPSICSALRQTAEELLCHICLYFANGRDRPASLGEAMAAFHVLSNLLRSHSGQFVMQRGFFTRDTPRQLWRVHYRTLSQIVGEGLVYHPSPLHRDHDSLEHKGLLEDEEYMKARQQQRAELKRVEANYETILLRETQFPKANVTNQEVKDWVELVMSNWRTMCGSGWTDAELGEGGKLAVGRTTLDVGNSCMLPRGLHADRMTNAPARYYTALKRRRFTQHRSYDTYSPYTRISQSLTWPSRHLMPMLNSRREEKLVWPNQAQRA